MMGQAQLKTVNEDSIDTRIRDAFSDGTSSDTIAALIEEAERVALRSNDEASAARERALDPSLPSNEVIAARRAMDDALFRRDRLQTAAAKLRPRLYEVRANEDNVRHLAEYEKATAERDKLVVELRDLYPKLADQLQELLSGVAANDEAVEAVNTHWLPRGKERLLVAELVARGLEGFTRNYIYLPRITRDTRLPNWQGSGRPYAWPPSGEVFHLRSG
jgi:hypothetical protein